MLSWREHAVYEVLRKNVAYVFFFFSALKKATTFELKWQNNKVELIVFIIGVFQGPSTEAVYIGALFELYVFSVLFI